MKILDAVYALFPRLDPNWRGTVVPYTASAAISTIPAAGLEIEGARDGWVELAGAFSGCTWRWGESSSGNGDVPASLGDFFPLDRNGRGILLAPSGAAGTVRWTIWDFSTGLVRAMSRATVSSISRTPSGASAIPDQVVSDGVLVASIAGAQATNFARGTSGRVVTDQNNAIGGVYIADTQAKAALLGAAGGGTPLYATGTKTWAGILWVASAAGTDKTYIDRNT